MAGTTGSNPSSTEAAVRAGDVVAGKYRVDRVLGIGGMGVVVAATHEQLDQRVALKFLHGELVGREDVVERFLREARAAVRIRSEHVARVLDVGTLETGAPYMVMEYLEGEDLEHVLERGPLPEATAVGYLLEACEAIAEAHSLGIVHRDLKPANLFLATSPSGSVSVKVLDFGISKAPLTGKEKALTKEATMMGTPSYMSPEQMRASPSVDARADIWALGVILHELITGTVPFEGDSMPTLITSILALQHPRAGIGRPTPLQPAIDRCLEKVPERRFANVAEFAAAIVPFGPPRGEQSFERISMVLAHAPGDRSSVVMPPAVARARTADSGAAFHATVAVTTGSGASAARPADRASPRYLLVAIPLALLLSFPVVLVLIRRPTRTDTASAQTATSEPVEAHAVAPPPPETPPTSSGPNVQPAVVNPPPSAAPPPAPDPPVLSAAPIVHGKWPNRAAPTAQPTASPAAAPSAQATPACKVVPYFDADGIKHFRKDCP